MVDGAFDPLHHGHVEYFTRAREVGGRCCATSPLIRTPAPSTRRCCRRPQRAAVIDALKPIDFTHVSPVDTETVLRELQPTHYIKGKDWEGRLPPEQVRICRKEGIEIVYLDTVRDSSTQLLKTFQSGPNGHVDLPAFENLVFTQKVIEPEHYDSDYFVSDWRQAGNDYTIETPRQDRRTAPAGNQRGVPAETSTRCGLRSGALMFLLQEVGIAADGVDFAPSTRELAPAEVRDRITVGPVADRFPENAYDLVICREVFEHLTVLQVREASGTSAGSARSSRMSRRGFIRIRRRCSTSPRSSTSIRRISRCSTRICSGCSSCSRDSASARISKIGSTGWARGVCSSTKKSTSGQLTTGN